MKQTLASIPNKYILYAEDDADDQAFLKEILKATDDTIEVLSVHNGAEVLKFLRNLPADVPLPCFILLDINMPIMDGFETMENLQSNILHQSIPVIFFSTASSHFDQDRALAMGAKSYVSKPFSVEAMMSICESFVRTCHSEVISHK